MTGDFNRWDSYWRRNSIRAHSQQGESAGLIDFLSDLGLIQLLQRGTQTYHSPLGNSSTIDLIFISKRLARSLLKCKLYNTHHGSDHEAIKTLFDPIISEATHTPRFLFKNAPWKKIREDISRDLEHGKLSALPSDLNKYISQLLALVTSLLQK